MSFQSQQLQTTPSDQFAVKVKRRLYFYLVIVDLFVLCNLFVSKLLQGNTSGVALLLALDKSLSALEIDSLCFYNGNYHAEIIAMFSPDLVGSCFAQSALSSLTFIRVS